MVTRFNYMQYYHWPRQTQWKRFCLHAHRSSTNGRLAQYWANNSTTTMGAQAIATWALDSKLNSLRDSEENHPCKPLGLLLVLARPGPARLRNSPFVTGNKATTTGEDPSPAHH